MRVATVEALWTNGTGRGLHEMNTYETIQSDIKSAMKTGDTVRRDCLRSLMSEIKNQTVNAGKELTEDIVVKCVQKAVKQHDDSIAQFKAANRTDLVEKEVAELEVLKAYLPKMLSEDETKAIIDNVLQTVEATKKNMGLIMKQLPSEVDRKVAAKYLNGILK